MNHSLSRLSLTLSPMAATSSLARGLRSSRWCSHRMLNGQVSRWVATWPSLAGYR